MGLVGNGRDGGDVQHVQPRVAHGFTKKQLCVGSYGGTPTVNITGFDKSGFDTEAPHRVMQQVLRSTIQRGGGHDVGARAHQRGHAQVQGGLATGHADRTNAPFKCSHPLFQYGIGGVADARIDMAGPFQVE